MRENSYEEHLCGAVILACSVCVPHRISGIMGASLSCSCLLPTLDACMCSNLLSKKRCDKTKCRSLLRKKRCDKSKSHQDALKRHPMYGSHVANAISLAASLQNHQLE